MIKERIALMGMMLIVGCSLGGDLVPPAGGADLPPTLKDRPLQGALDIVVEGGSRLYRGAPSRMTLRILLSSGPNQSRPLPGATLDLALREKEGTWEEVLWRGSTDDQGLAHATFTGPTRTPGAYEAVARVRAGELSHKVAFPVTLDDGRVIRITTDRPLYQPGQKMHVRALVVSQETLQPLEGVALTITVQDGGANAIERQELTTDPFGLASLTIALADHVAEGRYVITARAGEASCKESVMVRSYILPRFHVLVQPERTLLGPDQDLKVMVKASTFYGKAITRGRVRLEARGERSASVFVPGSKDGTDEDGAWQHTFPAASLPQGTISLVATVTDRAGRSETGKAEVVKDKAGLKMALVAEAGGLVRGVRGAIYALLFTPDGRPSAGHVKAVVGSAGLTVEADAGPSGVAVLEPRLDKMDLARAGRDRVEIYAMATSPQGDQAEAKLSVSLSRADLAVRTDRPAYPAGGAVTVTVSSQEAGEVRLEATRSGRTLWADTITLAPGAAGEILSASTVLMPGPGQMGLVEIHAFRPDRDRTTERAAVVYLAPQSRLDLAIDVQPKDLAPGQEGTITLTAKGPHGQGQVAAVELSAIDEALFALAQEHGTLRGAGDFTLQDLPSLETPLASLLRASLERLANGEGDDPDRTRAAVALSAAKAGVHTPQRADSRVERRLAMRAMLKRVHGALLRATLEGVTGQRGDDGRWGLRPGLVEALAASGALERTDTTDPWGRPLTRERLGEYSEALTFGPLAGVIGSLKVWAVANATADMMVSLKEELRAMVKARGREEAREALVEGLEARLLDSRLVVPADLTDPWGQRVRLVGLPMADSVVALSAGPDGIFHTPDDVGAGRYKPSEIYHLPQWGLMDRTDGRDNIEGLISSMRWGRSSVSDDALMAALEPLGFVMGLGLSGTGQGSGGGYGGLGMASGRAVVMGARGALSPVRVRQTFLDTLLYRPKVVTLPDGRAIVPFTMADSITTWRIRAFGHTQGGLMGAAVGTMRSFQPFFVEVDLPQALTDGDRLEVPVMVYNYLPRPQGVDLEVRVGGALTLASAEGARLEVGPVDQALVRVTVVARGKGEGYLEVVARGQGVADAIRRTARVKPQGEEVRLAWSGSLGEGARIRVVVPEEAIDGTATMALKVYSSGVGAAVENMDALLAEPHGCFEQTSSATYPNLLVLRYLRGRQGKLSARARDLVSRGYQRLMTFEVPGGGFDWFGRSPAHGTLTAYGLLEFTDMARVFPVDPSLIERTRRFLVRRQRADGSFGASGEGMDAMGARGRDELVSTAYVAWALAASGGREAREAATRALSYLEPRLGRAKSGYLTALAAAAATEAEPGSKRAGRLVAALVRLGVAGRGGMVWEPGGQTALHGGGEAAVVETTALAALALHRAGGRPDLVGQAIGAILERRSPQGHFGSTQATVLALKALTAQAEEPLTGDRELMVTVDGREAGRLVVGADQGEMVHQLDLTDRATPGAHDVEIRGPQGEGAMAYQVVTSAWVPLGRAVRRGNMSLAVSVQRGEIPLGETGTLTVEARARKGVVSMAVMRVGLPPGFRVDQGKLGSLTSAGLLGRYEVSPEYLTLYLRRLTVQATRIDLDLHPLMPGRVTLPASVIYQYYHPEDRASAPPLALAAVGG